MHVLKILVTCLHQWNKLQIIVLQKRVFPQIWRHRRPELGRQWPCGTCSAIHHSWARRRPTTSAHCPSSLEGVPQPPSTSSPPSNPAAAVCPFPHRQSRRRRTVTAKIQIRSRRPGSSTLTGTRPRDCSWTAVRNSRIETRTVFEKLLKN